MNASVARRRFKKYSFFYLLAAPGIVYFILFHYAPMWGLLLSFQEFSPYLGFWKSPWVGFDHYVRFFSNRSFTQLLSNTLMLSFYNLIFYFPFTIFLALLLNEVRWSIYRRVSQTVLYLPHFVSWVIIGGMTVTFFGPSGIINHYLEGWFGVDVPFLMSNEWFRPMMVLQTIWKDAGWGTIIFLAALSGINPELYEAAKVDGAGRLRSIWHIALPGVRSTIVILLLLRLGNSLDSNFLQIFLMTNNLNIDVSDVFDLYVYRVGLLQGSWSFATAVGLFKSLASIILVTAANYVAKLLGEDGIF